MTRLLSPMLLASLGVLLGACAFGSGRSGPEVQVATGNNGSVAWQAATYMSAEEGLCLQVRVTGTDPSTVCGLDGTASGAPITWSIVTDAGTIVAVMSSNQDAVGATLVMADGATLPVAAGTAPAITTLRYFIVAIPDGVTATELDIQGAGGKTLAVAPLP